jgi:Transposase IS116/IS110/IS902 family
LIEACDETIPFEACEAPAPLVVQLRNLDEAIARLDRSIAKLALKDETARGLMSIPGFGPITASAMAATIQDTSSFAGPREFATLLGLTPKQNSSGGQAEAGAHFEDGQSELAQTAGRGRPWGVVSPQAVHRPAADVGPEADREENPSSLSPWRLPTRWRASRSRSRAARRSIGKVRPKERR